MPRLALALLICLVSLAVGCGDDEAEPAASVEGSWTLADGIDVDGWEKTPPTAVFADGKLTGSTGCNRYTGSFEVDAGQLTLGDVASTRMACSPPAGDVEREFLDKLGRVGGFGSSDDELTLVDSDGGELLRFRAAGG